MDKFLVGFLFLANAHLITSMSGDNNEYFITESPTAARKLGKHNLGCKIVASSSSSSPSGSPKSEENAEFLTEVTVSEERDGASPVLKINHHHHHLWIDEPVAGGGVILGGLLAAFLVTVSCYIRVTRRRNVEQPSSPTNLSTLIPNKERS